MTISGGNPKIFYGSTINVTLLVLSAISIATPFIMAWFKARKESAKKSA
jgi:TctA family transporter